ncbi:MAG: TolC family outer membrane protein [Stenotrophobium sp.]
MKKFIAAVLPAAFLFSAAAHSLTLREAAELALRHDPRMLAGGDAVNASQAVADQATAGYRPNVNAAASVGRANYWTSAPFPVSGTRWPNTESLDVSQPLYAGGAISGRADAAASGMDSARESLRDSGSQIILSAVSAYLDVLRDRGVVALSEADVRTLDQAHTDTLKRTAAGETTHTDDAQSAARLAEGEARLKTAIAQLHVSEAAFRRVTGAEPAALVDGWPRPQVPASFAEALAQSAHAPAVLAAQADARVAHAQIGVAGAARMPQVSLDGNVNSQANTEFGYDRFNEWNVLLKVSLPIYQGGMIRARVSEAQARADQAREMAENTRLAFAEAATQEWERLQASDEVIRAYQAQQQAAELALDGTRKELAVGTRTTLDLLNADRELLSAQVNVVGSLHDRAVTAFRLLAACGSLDAGAVP